MFLTLEQFLGHFPPLAMTREEFVERLTVTYTHRVTLGQLLRRESVGGRPPLIKKDDDLRYQRREEIIDYFYEILITRRHHYLERFYHSFFAFKPPTALRWEGIDLRLKEVDGASDDPRCHSARGRRGDHTEPGEEEEEGGATGKGSASLDIAAIPMANFISLQKNDAGRVMIRNLYYRELLDLTRITNTVQSHASFWSSFEAMYNHLLLPDRMFAPSSIALFLRPKGTKKNEILKEINYNNLYYLFQAYQPKASILNPYTIRWILGEFFGGATALFTPVLSWSSYLVAMMHTQGIRRYLGVDVMPSVCAKTRFLAEYYGGLGEGFRAKEVEVLCRPSEDLAADAAFVATQRGRWDAILLCPPYYGMEVYHEGEQSVQRYPEYRAWIEGYWRPTARLCATLASAGGRMGVIINDYYDLQDRFYPLCADLHAVTTEWWELIDVYYLYNRTSPLRAAGKARYERFYLYRRKV